MADLARSCGWIYFYDRVAFISGRPRVKTIVVQRGGRPVHILHCQNGPAMSFSDGYAIYSWRGVAIPHQYYQKAPSPSEILAERNAEVRRALIERYDYLTEKGRFMQDCGARVIDSAIQPMKAGAPEQINELLSIDLPHDPEGQMTALKIIDPSTGRTYIIRVPPDQTTVKGALAWSFNVREKDYLLQQES